MRQRGRAPDEVVPVVITTHGTEEAATTRSLARIGGSEAVSEPRKRYASKRRSPSNTTLCDSARSL